MWRNKRMKEHREQNTTKTINVFSKQPPTAPYTDVPPNVIIVPLVGGLDQGLKYPDTSPPPSDPETPAAFPTGVSAAGSTSTFGSTQGTFNAGSPSQVNGTPSWEVAFKLPLVKTIYVCSDTQRSLTSRNDVDDWLKEKLCGVEKWTGWLCYNDQCWKYNTQGTPSYKEWNPDDKVGHCKGVLTWNAEHVGWLVHSLPHWPCPAEFNLKASKLGVVHHSQLKLAQNLAFMWSPRFADGKDFLDTIVSQIRSMEAYVYMCFGIHDDDDSLQSQQLFDWKKKARNPRSDTTSSQSEKRRVECPKQVPSDFIGYEESKKTAYTEIKISSNIRHIAKSKLYNADIYEVLPTKYKGEWWARTRLQGKGLDKTFDSKEEEEAVEDILKDVQVLHMSKTLSSLKNLTDVPKNGPAAEKQYICPPNSNSWSQGSEHSKWAVSSSGDYVFVGDNNRIEKQKNRGGGGFLLTHPGLNKALMSWKTEVPPPVKKKSSTPVKPKTTQRHSDPAYGGLSTGEKAALSRGQMPESVASDPEKKAGGEKYLREHLKK
jgi:hypothetical protein